MLIVANMLIAVFVMAFRQWPIGLGLVAVVALLVNGAFLRMHFRDRDYHARLKRKIESQHGIRGHAPDRLQP